jgi:hypothetical protein
MILSLLFFCMPKRKVTKEKGSTKKNLPTRAIRFSRTCPEGSHFSCTSHHAFNYWIDWKLLSHFLARFNTWVGSPLHIFTSSQPAPWGEEAKPFNLKLIHSQITNPHQPTAHVRETHRFTFGLAVACAGKVAMNEYGRVHQLADREAKKCQTLKPLNSVAIIQ